MIAESDARVLEVRRQVEEERARYEEKERWREFKIERLQRIARAVDIEAYESQNAARVATAELARAKAQPVGVAHCVATPAPAYADNPRQSPNASPRRQANLRPPAIPEGGYQGYCRVEDSMRETIAAVEGCNHPKHRCYADELSSNAGSLGGSLRMQVATQPPVTGTNRGVPRERGVGGPPGLGNRPAKTATPAPRNHVSLEELERMIRHTRLAQRRSSGSSPSSSDTSHSTQHSHHSRHSHRSHASRHDSRHVSRHGSRHSHRSRHGSRHRCRSRRLPIPCSVPKFKRGCQIPIKIWIQQMEYYFSITGMPERKYVKAMINHFETTHRPQVQLYKTHSYPEFRKKVISIFIVPDNTRINTKS